MKDNLTPQQRQAVENRGGQLLVSAAAGSGKTKVLVDRLLRYLTDPSDPANLDEFLIITYTKAAASELRGKIAAKLTERIALEPENTHLQKQMQRLFLTKISTVHGFCGDILREYAYKLDLSPDFRIADENECLELRDQVMKELLDKAYAQIDSDPDFRAFTDTQGLGRNDAQVPEIIEKVYDSARCHKDPDKWLEDCLTAAKAADLEDVSETLWGSYLLEDLREYTQCQITALQAVLSRTERYPEYEKVGTNLTAIIQQLETIRSAKTWDEAAALRKINYPVLRGPKKDPAPGLFERIKAVRDGCKEGMEKKLHSFSDDSHTVIRDLQESEAGIRGLIALVRQFDRDYSAVKKRRRCLDFSDLEHKTLDLLLGSGRTSPTAAAGEISRRFREIMVDEYQDSNGVQDAIFGALTSQRNNCFMVGDVKQSIYQFRLADPGIFLEKYNRFASAAEAAAGQGRKILLSHNFRSGGEVVDAVNDVFSVCMRPKVGGLKYGEEEALHEGIPHTPLPDPGVELHVVAVKEETYPEEAAYVAEKIENMLSEGTLIRDGEKLRPVKPEDIVILLRSPGSAASYFQKAFRERGIRFTSGSGTDLLATREIETIRAILQTIQNPRLDIPLITALASPVFGFSADLLGKIRSRQKKGCFYDALLLDDSRESRRFLLILDTLRRDAGIRSLTELIEHCYGLTHIDSIFGAMPAGEVKAANLQMFYQMAVDFEKGSVRDLSQFLEYLTSLEGKGLTGKDASAAGCVTIMSIHKSKGLEFPVVFLCNLSRKFNQQSLRAPVLCDKKLGVGVSIADSENRIRYPSAAKRAITVKMQAESISEEMRVLYVAMTRAKDRLIMTYGAQKPEKKLSEISRRMDFDGGELLCRDAGCMGDWILLTALGKTEAGELHNLGDRPEETTLSAFPWKIDIVQAPEAGTHILQQEDGRKVLPQNLTDKLRKSLQYEYPYQQATMAPSKQTATGRKGRVKDQEAAQNTREQKEVYHAWRKPSFVQTSADPIAYGNAMHAAMQHIRYEYCTGEEAIKKEISYLLEKGILSGDQCALIDCSQLSALFQTTIGRMLAGGVSCIREFKFSILDDGSHYGEGLVGEQVLLQGVVDCAIIEEDGITVIDFKTDRVTQETLRSAAAQYRPQVEAYAQAMSRIYEMPVKKACLYFFRVGQFVDI